MLRNAIVIVIVAITAGLYAFRDYSKPRALEPTLTAKFMPVPSPLNGGSSVPEPQQHGGMPPWNDNEKIYQNGRNSIRKSTMNGLDKAWSTFCQPEGRQRLAQSVSYYFEMRGNQEESYQKRWGDDGRNYIAREWSTSDDARIQRLVQEHYERGYLKIADFRPFIAKRIEPLLKDVRVPRNDPCAS
jgi:hypothetical protein